MNLDDIILDKSPEQKAALINRRREELKPYGYSVVDSKWLASVVANANWNGGSNGKAKATRSDRSQEGLTPKGHPKIKRPHKARA